MRIFCLFGLLSISLTACSLIPGAPPIEVHGHRGLRGSLPENTLQGFDRAIEIGVDYIELDLGVSKDGQLVVYHDENLNPALCLGPDGNKLESQVPLFKLSLNALKQLDCGSLQNSNFPNQKAIPGARIPSLREVFELVKTHSHPNAKTVQFNIETKLNPKEPDLTVAPEKFVALVLALVKEFEFLDRSILQSFDPRTLNAARLSEPKLRRSLLLNEEPNQLLELIERYEPQIISPRFDWLKEKHMQQAAQAEVKVVPWTVNKEEDWKRMKELHVDGIITDYPEELIVFLKK